MFKCSDVFVVRSWVMDSCQDVVMPTVAAVPLLHPRVPAPNQLRFGPMYSGNTHYRISVLNKLLSQHLLFYIPVDYSKKAPCQNLKQFH